MDLLMFLIGCGLAYGIVSLKRRKPMAGEPTARAIRHALYSEEAQQLIAEYGFKPGAKDGILMDTRHKYLPRLKRVVHVDVDTAPDTLTRQLKAARRSVDRRAKRFINTQVANLEVPSDIELLEAQAMTEKAKPHVKMEKGTH